MKPGSNKRGIGGRSQLLTLEREMGTPMKLCVFSDVTGRENGTSFY